MGENTTNRPTDLASAKAEAMAHVRKCLARQAETDEPEAEAEAGPRHP